MSQYHHLLSRPRRNRKTPVIRSLVKESHLSLSQCVYPYFLCPGIGICEAIPSLPHLHRYSVDYLLKDVEECLELGISSFALFPVVPQEWKDENGSYALREDNFLCDAIVSIKKHFPHVCLISDVALDPYTSHGHDGIWKDHDVHNDQTIDVLTQMSVLHAAMGIDIVAPSDMMDGRVFAIRQELDRHDFSHVSIMSYSVKYASSLYSPFRKVLSSTPRALDKRTYQMDPANQREALRESSLDTQEGADFLLVKPAGWYVDVIHKIKQRSYLPIVAYQVSGEYAMIAAASQQQWLDFDQALLESLQCIRRSGADIIFSYGIKYLAKNHSNL